MKSGEFDGVGDDVVARVLVLVVLHVLFADAVLAVPVVVLAVLAVLFLIFVVKVVQAVPVVRQFVGRTGAVNYDVVLVVVLPGTVSAWLYLGSAALCAPTRAGEIADGGKRLPNHLLLLL